MRHCVPPGPSRTRLTVRAESGPAPVIRHKTRVRAERQAIRFRSERGDAQRPIRRGGLASLTLPTDVQLVHLTATDRLSSSANQMAGRAPWSAVVAHWNVNEATRRELEGSLSGRITQQTGNLSSNRNTDQFTPAAVAGGNKALDVTSSKR
jgi:hypothetical protein